jgi:hypothetical protein
MLDRFDRGRRRSDGCQGLAPSSTTGLTSRESRCEPKAFDESDLGLTPLHCEAKRQSVADALFYPQVMLLVNAIMALGFFTTPILLLFHSTGQLHFANRLEKRFGP